MTILNSGSVISPAMCNIYSEDLLHLIGEEASVSTEDLLAYADDLLVLCSSPHQLRQVIRIIQKWSKENNLGLNAKKSGIIEFLPRYGNQKSSLKLGSRLEEIPIVAEYKYLGLWLNKKLTMEPQLTHIKKKSKFIRARLAPIMKNISLDYRMNLWTIFIRPLFDQLASLYNAERTNTNPEKARTLLRTTFKDFTLLPRNTDGKIIKKLMRYNIDLRTAYMVEKNTLKWEARKNRTTPNYDEMTTKRPENGDRNPMPKELQEYISLQTALCPKCKLMGKKVAIRDTHLAEHNISIPAPIDLLEEISKLVVKKSGYLCRRETLVARKNYIQPHILQIQGFLNSSTAISPH